MTNANLVPDVFYHGVKQKLKAHGEAGQEKEHHERIAWIANVPSISQDCFEVKFFGELCQITDITRKTDGDKQIVSISFNSKF